MRPQATLLGPALLALVAIACSPGSASIPPTRVSIASGTPSMTPLAPARTTPAASAASSSSMPSFATPGSRTLLFDTDVAADDLVALSFLAAAPNVELVGITVSGTGEAHCAAGVDVVLRLLERLEAAAIPVACGREAPLAGTHAFPDAWREHVDGGSGLELPPTSREPAGATAVELISQLSKDHHGLRVLTTGPLTNLADALGADAGLAGRLGSVVVMGGALHVPGNIAGPGAPQGNARAEWNIYVDPHAAQVVVDAGLDLTFVSLDGTNQVPVTYEFVGRAIEPADGAGRQVLADLLRANPFMTSGYYLWDPLAAEVAAGYDVGSFSDARVEVIEEEGPASGFTKPVDGAANIRFLGDADAPSAEDTLLRVLGGD